MCSGVLASSRFLVLSCTDPDTRMAPTRGQTVAAGVFDAQSAVERLEAEMMEIRGDITQLKQSTSGISEIQQKMVTMDALDALMQKYLPTQSASAITVEQEGTSQLQATKPLFPAATTTANIATGSGQTVLPRLMHPVHHQNHSLGVQQL